MMGLALFLSWGCCSESAQAGADMAAGCLLPARRRNVRSQAVGTVVAPGGRGEGASCSSGRLLPGSHVTLVSAIVLTRPPPRRARVCVALFL